MPRYLLLMYNKEMRMPENVTREQMIAGIKPWMDYLDPLTKGGRVESVGPVEWEGKMLTEKGVEEYKPREIDLGGYLVIKANDINEAIELAKKSPHYLAKMGPTTIREIREVAMPE